MAPNARLATWPSLGDLPTPGVLEALLRRAGHDVEVVGARTFKSIRKYRAGDKRSAERRSILGLVLHAREAKADVLVFSRDRDRDDAREKEVEAGIADALRQDDPLAVVGGVAIEAIEAWILELLGDERSERHARPKQPLADTHTIRDLAAMVSVIEGADLPPADEESSLRRWLRRLEAVGAPQTSEKPPSES